MGGAPKEARVYFRRDGTQVLVVALHTTRDGRLLEEAGPLSLRTWDDEALGESVLTALDRCTTVPKDRKEYGFGKESLLKASGEPSLRALEACFLEIKVSSVEGAHPGFVLQGTPDRETSLMIADSFPSQTLPADLARQITRFFQICRDRKF